MDAFLPLQLTRKTIEFPFIVDQIDNPAGVEPSTGRLIGQQPQLLPHKKPLAQRSHRPTAIGQFLNCSRLDNLQRVIVCTNCTRTYSPTRESTCRSMHETPPPREPIVLEPRSLLNHLDDAIPLVCFPPYPTVKSSDRGPGLQARKFRGLNDLLTKLYIPKLSGREHLVACPV